MLTRLKVDGFKNLVGVDVRFGPFTCIAGANGVGKSNLFDAIRFLAALADNRLVEAAKLVREGRTADVRSLFHRVGEDYAREMTLEAEMIVPREGVDDLGQRAVAASTFLRYKLVLARREAGGSPSAEPLEIRSEELVHITQKEARDGLRFPHNACWRDTAVIGTRSSPLISTSFDKIKFNRDLPTEGREGSGGGRPTSYIASTLPRTVLSVANASENRTATMARRELRSWQLLQLVPSALREPNFFTDPDALGPDGANLAATLYRLAHAGAGPPGSPMSDRDRIYARVANRLAELIDDVRDVRVDSDIQRAVRTLQVRASDGTWHQARALSDGTLRFLALAIIDLDPSWQGVLCLEEPENGLHPERIPAMVGLLQDIATDTYEPVDRDNPLRQVIVNTHSPSVVGEVPDESLLVARPHAYTRGGVRFRGVRFGCFSDTWRGGADEGVDLLPRGDLGVYLNPNSNHEGESFDDRYFANGETHRYRRVADRPDLRPFLPGLGPEL